MCSSHRGGVDTVILGMRADKPDVAHAIGIVNGHHEAVVIAFDVEHDAIVTNEAGVRVDLLDGRWRTPLRPLRVVVPRTQWLFSVRMSSPKLTQCALSDDSHVRQA